MGGTGRLSRADARRGGVPLFRRARARSVPLRPRRAQRRRARRRSPRGAGRRASRRRGPDRRPSGDERAGIPGVRGAPPDRGAPSGNPGRRIRAPRPPRRVRRDRGRSPRARIRRAAHLARPRPRGAHRHRLAGAARPPQPRRHRLRHVHRAGAARGHGTRPRLRHRRALGKGDAGAGDRRPPATGLSPLRPGLPRRRDSGDRRRAPRGADRLDVQPVPRRRFFRRALRRRARSDRRFPHLRRRRRGSGSPPPRRAPLEAGPPRHQRDRAHPAGRARLDAGLRLVAGAGDRSHARAGRADHRRRRFRAGVPALAPRGAGPIAPTCMWLDGPSCARKDASIPSSAGWGSRSPPSSIPTASRSW